MAFYICRSANYSFMEGTLLQQLRETTAFIKQKYKAEPSVGIVLGSGLGRFINGIDIDLEIPYSELPHFPVRTVPGHDSKLIFGRMYDKKIVVMSGRFHYYEGYTAAQ